MKKSLVCLIAVAMAGAVLINVSFGQKPATPEKRPAAPSQVVPTKKKPKAPAKPSGSAIKLKKEAVGLKTKGHQIDFPAPVRTKSGEIFVVYLDHDGVSDSLKIAQAHDDEFETVATLVESGVLHPPTAALDGEGKMWVFWSETNIADDSVDLLARSWSPEGLGEATSIADTDSSEAFADSGTDSEGNVWVVWQSMRAGEGDIFARKRDAKTGDWSEEIPVEAAKGGDWEPKLAFDNSGSAWVTYDASRGNEFNINLAKIAADGSGVTSYPIGHSDRYEARADIVPTIDGSGFWIAAERGRVRWGLDARGHDNSTGLNAQKEILFGKFDVESEEFTEHPLGPAGQMGAPVNLPTIGVGADGNPWVAYRYFERVLWRVAVTRFDQETKTWSSRRRLDGASFGQDRRLHFLPTEDDLHLCWSSDQRKTKAHQEAGIFLATLDSKIELPPATTPGNPKDLTSEPFAPSQKTPERPADDRHTWEVGGKKLGLYWGDLHRHTDVSNCRTGFDGCIAEHFRYAYDIAKLDFLGTSDHTDIGKIYHPYEWWHNQRQHDAFHSAGKFTSLYVYEREQRWPWGHRNVVFAQRGGPIVYIKRKSYRESPWQETLPIPNGVGEINPPELWDALKRYGKPVALISHTGATGMGTDWGKYENFDYTNEGIVEIFQGARVSYEGSGAPQPTAGLKPDEDYTVNGDADATPPEAIDDFGKYKAGTYQNALDLGLKLGIFTSSDHISQHVCYGGVFVENFTREEVVAGFNSRQTIAATDKIYLNFTCNGEILGSEIETEKAPEIWLKVDGTADLKKVTIIRNEKNWKVFDNISGTKFEETVTDDAMLEGVNRYYIRVEQVDGNMAWASPIWVTKK